MSKFFCDTNSEISFEKARELNINVIKMPYTIGDEMYFYDLGENTDIANFFDKMRKGASAKTQALNIGEYTEIFEPVFASGEDVLYVSFSHQMSGTFNSMQLAINALKEKYPDRKFTVVDTESISMGAGAIVEQCAKLHNSGASDEEVVAFMQEFKQKAKIYFTVSDLKYLVRGGRISAFSGAMGTLLDLKPLITCKEGKLSSIAKIKGRKKSLFALAEKLISDGVDYNYPVIIMDADSKADGDFLQSIVEKQNPEVTVLRQYIGPVVGAHCGPDTLGIVFVAKE